MNDLISGGDTLTMSSREIAELVESRHDNVKRAVERLAERGVIALPPMEEVSNDGPGPKVIAEYRLGKRDSYVVVAQLSPEFTARLVDRWQELEAKVAKVAMGLFAIPQTLHDALRLAADLAEENAMTKARNALLEQTVAEQAPKAEFADKVANADGAHTMAEAAKILGVGRNRLFDLLRQRRVLSGTTPYQQHIDAGRFIVRERPYVQGGESRLYAQTFVTGKGLQFIQRLVEQPLVAVH